MMNNRVKHVLVIAFMVGTLSGCFASTPVRFYTLESTATAVDAPAVPYAVEVQPVSVPASVDRSQIVVQVAPNRVEVNEFNIWAAPLSDGIAHTITRDLIVLLGSSKVATGPIADFAPAYRVTVDIQRFNSVLGEAVQVDAVWTIRALASGHTSSGRTSVHEAAPGPGFEGLAAAHSRALAKVSTDIAAAIRALAEEPVATRSGHKK